MPKRNKITIFTITRRKIIAGLLLLIFFAATSAGVSVALKINEPRAAFRVVIDAGHGGVDGGVVGKLSGVKESEINLEMAKTLATYFEKAGVEVVLTRKNKYGLYDSIQNNFKLRDFEKRKEIIMDASPDIVISLHANYFKSAPSRRGAQVFFNPAQPYSRALAAEIQNTINKEINMKYAKRAFSQLAGDYYMLNSTDFPSVIVECGFLSNAEDEKLLTDENYRKEFCYHLFSASMRYMFTQNN